MHLLQTIWKKWKVIAHHMGIFQSRVILTLFYFILLLPVGLIFSLVKDEMGLKNKKTSTWKKKRGQAETMEEMREQF